MNAITDNLPATLDELLADFAQAHGKIDYGDIISLGKSWPSLTDAERIRIQGLVDKLTDMSCDPNEPDLSIITDQLAEAIKQAGKIPPANPGIRAGDLILYRNGDSFELGLVKRVTDTGAFVYYSDGDTASKTPFDCIHRIVNSYAVAAVTLGGPETRLENGHAAGLREAVEDA